MASGGVVLLSLLCGFGADQIIKQLSDAFAPSPVSDDDLFTAQWCSRPPQIRPSRWFHFASMMISPMRLRSIAPSSQVVFGSRPI